MRISESSFETRMQEIVAAIRQTGLNPYAQISGYLRTGNDAYITTHENARGKIKCLDTGKVQRYIEKEKQNIR
nr:IreB family regulatory phosphoprotein [uncultured Oscillibacter sp.]